MKCTFRSYVKGGGGIRCAIRNGDLVINETCQACQGERKHVSDHPRAKDRKLPKVPGEQPWLDLLGIGAHKPDA